MNRSRPMAMVTVVNKTLNVYYNDALHLVYFAEPVGETSVEHNGNALRIYWKYRYDLKRDPWRDAFEIAIDDIGFPGATIHPLGPLT